MITPETRKSHFYLPMLTLPLDRRQALLSVYAFCRHADDLADTAKISAEERVHLLCELEQKFRQTWREGTGGGWLHAVAVAARQYDLPWEWFQDFLCGIQGDIVGWRLRTDNDVREYCRKVAGTVGLMSIRIMGRPEAEDYAVGLGEALQRTNILRDFLEDTQRGRVYFSEERLERFGLTPDAVLQNPDTRQTLQLLHDECMRVEKLYDALERTYSVHRAKSLLSARLMHGIYKYVFDRICTNPGLVFTKRIRMSRWRQMQTISRIVFREWGLGWS